MIAVRRPPSAARSRRHASAAAWSYCSPASSARPAGSWALGNAITATEIYSLPSLAARFNCRIVSAGTRPDCPRSTRTYEQKIHHGITSLRHLPSCWAHISPRLMHVTTGPVKHAPLEDGHRTAHLVRRLPPRPALVAVEHVISHLLPANGGQEVQKYRPFIADSAEHGAVHLVRYEFGDPVRIVLLHPPLLAIGSCKPHRLVARPPRESGIPTAAADLLFCLAAVFCHPGRLPRLTAAHHQLNAAGYLPPSWAPTHSTPRSPRQTTNRSDTRVVAYERLLVIDRVTRRTPAERCDGGQVERFRSEVPGRARPG